MPGGNDPSRWIADRMRHIEISGIRRVFELGRALKDPINLSIGQPDFDVPETVKSAARHAIDAGYNGYTVTQGIADLRKKLQGIVAARYPDADRHVLVTSGTSGGLVLAICSVVNPGDEVIVLDPYFVMYPHAVTLAGGTTVFVDTYPHFDIDLDRVRTAMTVRTKAVIVNSPNNPTGRVYRRECLRDLALLCRERGVLLLSDEVYRAFTYDTPFCSPAEFNEDVLVFDGFSKTYGMTGWRLGYVHGPRRLIEEMIKLQQFTFVCAPSIVQHAGVAALDTDVAAIVADYRRKRDRIVNGLKDHYDLAQAQGAFYLFAAAPGGKATAFAEEAVRNNLLLIPGTAFSQRDTHFRLSYAATDETLDKGIEVLNRLARR
jgi:aspartate aminotransferase/aminotransferase